MPATHPTGTPTGTASGPATVSPDALGEALAALRHRGPLVQCLTNIVAAPWTANVLLATGAAPAMVDNVHEAGPFAKVADAVLVNLGTPYDGTAAAMSAAAATARETGTPWVLDPVAAGAAGWRTDVAVGLLAHRPTVLRGNASEVLALTGGAGGRGVDATDTPESAASAAADLTAQHGTVVAVSGPVDHLASDRGLVRLANGHEWLTRVTGVGCALGALMAAFSAAVEDPLVAAAGATATLTVAAEDAADASHGPGSFAVALLDALHALEPETVAARAEVR